MKKFNYCVIAMSVSACNLLFTACTKDEDFGETDYYKDWTPEEFNTFASRSISIFGEEENKPQTTIIGHDSYDSSVDFRVDDSSGINVTVRASVCFEFDIIKITIDENKKEYDYDVIIKVIDKTPKEVSISLQNLSIDNINNKANIEFKYTLEYSVHGINKSSNAYGYFNVNLF